MDIPNDLDLATPDEPVLSLAGEARTLSRIFQDHVVEPTPLLSSSSSSHFADFDKASILGENLDDFTLALEKCIGEESWDALEDDVDFGTFANDATAPASDKLQHATNLPRDQIPFNATFKDMLQDQRNMFSTVFDDEKMDVTCQNGVVDFRSPMVMLAAAATTATANGHAPWSTQSRFAHFGSPAALPRVAPPKPSGYHFSGASYPASSNTALSTVSPSVPQQRTAQQSIDFGTNRAPSESASQSESDEVEHTTKRQRRSTRSTARKRHPRVQEVIVSDPRGQEILNPLDPWQATFVRFLTLPSKHIYVESGDPVPLKKVAIWSRQKARWASNLDLPAHRGGNLVSHGRVVGAAVHGKDSVLDETPRRRSTMVRMNQELALWFDDEEHNREFGEWISNERKLYAERLQSPMAPPLFPIDGDTSKEEAISLVMEKGCPKPDRENIDLRFAHVEQTFRFHLLAMCGVEIETVSPEDTCLVKTKKSSRKLGSSLLQFVSDVDSCIEVV
jgi:hypothetical protein